jgi:hypothetical protein
MSVFQSFLRLPLMVAAVVAGSELRGQSVYATPYTFSTLAGGAGLQGDVDGTGVSARFAKPSGVAVDGAGNVYVADTNNAVIRKIDSAGVVTTFAGLPRSQQPNGGTLAPVDGTGSAALFVGPVALAIDGSGNLFVIDADYVRKVTSAGVVTTIAGSLGAVLGTSDGPAADANFDDPLGIAVDASGNVYIADTKSAIIRKLSTAGEVTTLAGTYRAFGSADGTAGAANFSSPTGVAVDASGNVYVSDSGNFEVRKITSGGVVTTLAGKAGNFGSADGTGSAAQFFGINGITVDASGDIFVTGADNTVRKITSAGVVTTLAGTTNVPGTSNGTGAAALFKGPTGIAVAANGDMLVVDTLNSTVRKRYAAANSQPSIAVQPTDQSVSIGGSATFTVLASGVPVPSYQWLFNGSYISGATNPSLTVANVQATTLGSYSVIVTSDAGSLTSSSAVLSSPGVAPEAPAAPTTPYFSNISTRAGVGTGGAIEIAGFVVSGPPGSTEQLLIRGVGPALSQFTIAGPLLQPVLTLFDSTGAQIATNTAWTTNSNSAQVATAAASVGAFALSPTVAADVSSNQPASADSALLISLPPGTYTSQVAGLGGTTGTALVEIYQVGASSAQLTNISTRALVGTGVAVEIAGLVVKGNQPSRVLIRAVGPTLAQFTVTGVLAQPTLTVVDAGGNTVATNTGWSTNANAATIASESAAVGAFALPSGSADCALLLMLQPGTYTAIVSGVGGTSGIALVEAYQAP